MKEFPIVYVVQEELIQGTLYVNGTLHVKAGFYDLEEARKWANENCKNGWHITQIKVK